eukprot:7789488-Alexandrium_andersonii.AAC.1
MVDDIHQQLLGRVALAREEEAVVEGPRLLEREVGMPVVPAELLDVQVLGRLEEGVGLEVPVGDR